MRKKEWYLLGGMAIILVCVIAFTLLFQPHESKSKLQLVGSQEVVENLNKTFKISYEKKSGKTAKIIYTNNGSKKELTDLSEYSVIQFYLDNKLVTPDLIEQEYLKDIPLNASVLLITNEADSDFVKLLKQVETEYAITISIVDLKGLSETTRKILETNKQINIGEALTFRIKKEDTVLFETNKALSKEELINLLNEKKLITVVEKPVVETPKEETTKPSNPKPSNPKPTPGEPTPPTPKPEQPKVYFEKIGAEKFKSLSSSSTKQIIVIGQKGCGFCEASLPVLEKIAKEKKVYIYYFDLKAEGNKNIPWDVITNMPSSVGTPFAVIIQNNKIIDSIIQKYTEKDYISFLQKNGLL